MPALDEVREQIGSIDGASKLLRRREIKKLPAILWEDERVERLVAGIYGHKRCVLVATNKRLLFVDKGLMSVAVEDFAYGSISSIQYETGMVMGSITIYASKYASDSYASGNRAQITCVAKERGRVFADHVRAIIDRGSSAPQADASAES